MTASVLAACSGSGSTPDAGPDRLAALRATTCPDGGCVAVTCPMPSGCSPGTSWLRDNSTGACCQLGCSFMYVQGFAAFFTQAECEEGPSCNGSPIGTVRPAGDGCNTCTCLPTQSWSCTGTTCADGGSLVQCGGFAGATCTAAEYCAYPPGDNCGHSDGQSVCRARPVSCTPEQAPACGCDGTDYDNVCHASLNGTGTLTLGPCRHFATCAKTVDCPADEFCLASTGRCNMRPLDCVNELSPVCGTDGVDYGNPCLAAKAGADIADAGLCP
jgi:hypothetical protein